MHVLNAASDLHVFAFGGDTHGTIVDGLQTRRAVAINCHATNFDGQVSHQGRNPSDIETLLTLLLDAPPTNVLDQVKIDARAFN
jgi:hypothetical protein